MNTKNFEKMVLIDLDGVLNQYDGKFDKNFIPSIQKDAKEFIEKISQDFELKLFTTRGKIIAQKWLKENNLGKYFSKVTNRKEPCTFLIDDRCIQFKGSFEKLEKDIRHFSVWWKN
mgnify:CR=1 FL=1